MFILSVVFLSHAHTLLVPAFLKDHAGQTSPSINPLIIMFGHKQPNLSKLMMVRSTRSCYLQVFMVQPVQPHFWIFLAGCELGDILRILQAASVIFGFFMVTNVTFPGDPGTLCPTGQFIDPVGPASADRLGNPRRSRFP